MCKIVRKTIKNNTKNSKTCEIVQKTIKYDTKTVKKSAKSWENSSKTILKTVKKLLYRNKIKDND